MEKSFVVCDLETTGLDPVKDRIIEVGLVRLEEGEIAGKLHLLVNPGRPLPLKIKRITGLDDSDLAYAPELSVVLPEILDFIGDAAIVGHNVRFDLGFLESARGLPFHNPAFDTLELARLVVPGIPSYRLDALCSYLNIDVSPSHRALDDALAAAGLLNVLVQKLREIDLEMLVRLSRLLLEARSGWHSFLSELVKELLKKFPDKKISDVPYLHWWEEKGDKGAAPRRDNSASAEKTFLNVEEVAELFNKDGPLTALLPAYEYRPQQEAMAGQITRALNEGKYLLMEAGTGVGKSMAYLVPSIMWGLLNKDRVLVATHTINLQEQLWLKDIPMLTEVIRKPIKAALVKGRQNYICLRRWIGALDSPHQPAEAAFLARVMTWLTVTRTGDKREINVAPGDGELWLNICGDAEGCLGSRCRYQKVCFVHKAKREAEEADLIIVNHSLLFSDVKAENKVLPAYGPLIIDEAHHLEESATVHLGRQFAQGALNRWLGIAGRNIAKMAEIATPGDGIKWVKSLKAAQEIRLEAIESARLFFQLLWEMAARNGPRGDGECRRLSLRLPCGDSRYEEFLTGGRKCLEVLRGFTDELRRCAELMELWAIAEEAWAGPSRDLAQLLQSGLTLINDFQFILENADSSFVYWAELELFGRSTLKNCSLLAAPIDVGALLYERFFKNKSTVVLTSATLTVNGSFDHLIERTGINNIPQERVARACFDSPFTYDRQALLCISRDLPVQGTVSGDLYLEKLENALYKIIEVTGGRTLVLFTAHRVLRETYRRLKTKLEDIDICLLGHGIDGSRSRLLEEFKTTGRTVLFGASSFWEGVDVPGEALSCVVLVKLPFQSPSEPVLEARLEDLTRRDKDGFRLLSVPKAVIRFKQGFGRLIRSGNDRGCVIILDGRVLNKSYGRQFLSSLPLKHHFRGGIDTITKKMSDWLGH